MSIMFDTYDVPPIPRQHKYCTQCYYLVHIVDWTYNSNPEHIRYIGSDVVQLTINHPIYTVNISCPNCHITTSMSYAQHPGSGILTPFQITTEIHGFF